MAAPINNLSEHDVLFMRLALEMAQTAYLLDEVPIGAVLVFEQRVIATGYNRTRLDLDPTAHAEIVALRAGAQVRNNYRLLGSTLYSTIEPCAMCAGALVWARVERLVYGASDLRAGAVDSVFQICTNTQLNHRLTVQGGLLADECRALMQDFFQRRRTLPTEG
ncbi:MAG: tRNA adenosine(34) deaminase TadA [Acidobacteriota bacterium]